MFKGRTDAPVAVLWICVGFFTMLGVRILLEKPDQPKAAKPGTITVTYEDKTSPSDPFGVFARNKGREMRVERTGAGAEWFWEGGDLCGDVMFGDNGPARATWNAMEGAPLRETQVYFAANRGAVMWMEQRCPGGKEQPLILENNVISFPETDAWVRVPLR